MSVTEDKTSVDAVLTVLESGGKFTPCEIGKACRLQDNTVIKNLKFLRDRGHDIQKERFEDGDRHYYRYYLCAGKRFSGTGVNNPGTLPGGSPGAVKNSAVHTRPLNTANREKLNRALDFARASIMVKDFNIDEALSLLKKADEILNEIENS